MRAAEKLVDRRPLAETPLMDEQDFVAEAARLAEIVGDQHDLGPASVQAGDAALDLLGGTGIKIRSRLIEKDDLRRQRTGPSEREALLFTAGQRARRMCTHASKADSTQRLLCSSHSLCA